MKTQFAWGWQIKPTFDEALDDTRKPLRIPLPDRRAKTTVNSFYRNKLIANERLAMGYEPAVTPPTHEERMDEVQQAAMGHDIARMQHEMEGHTIPAAVLEVAPSPSADDVVWRELMEHSKQHFENARQTAIRHRVDAESMDIMEGERTAALFDTHCHGRGNPILQGEAPPHEAFKTNIEESPAVGHFYREVVPRAAPIQLPLAAGYPAQKEFLPFRELNYWALRPTGRTGHPDFTKQGDSYETFRRATGSVHQNLW